MIKGICQGENIKICMEIKKVQTETSQEQEVAASDHLVDFSSKIGFGSSYCAFYIRLTFY